MNLKQFHTIFQRVKLLLASVISLRYCDRDGKITVKVVSVPRRNAQGSFWFVIWFVLPSY